MTFAEYDKDFSVERIIPPFRRFRNEDMMIEHVGHVAITVRDLDQTIGFYSKLGFEVVSRSETPERVVVFLQSGGAQLEVFGPKERVSEPPPLKDTDIGIKHIALMVDDIEAEYNALLKKGITFQSPPRKVGTGNIVTNFKDPDGIQLQLIQKK